MAERMAHGCFVDIYWMPMAAGTASRVRLWSLAAWEALDAVAHRRSRKKLYHSALKVRTAAGENYTIELTPVFGFEPAPPAMTGPVGFRGADRVRWFRYQMRCVRADSLPDEEWSVSQTRLSDDARIAESILVAAADVPPHTWGRRAKGTSEMWTSDSAISWLVRRVGLDAHAISIPQGGRAPGWVAGLEVPCEALTAG
ncbi:MAG: hypothetical protein AB7J35_22130 [Dehalococcoidia bacterium]